MRKHNTGPCSVDGCDRPARNRGMCPMHDMRVRAAEKRAKRIPCAVEGCTRFAYTRDLCATHNARWRKHGDTSITHKRLRPRGMKDAEWFWLHVEKTEECWFWTGTLDNGGYGKFTSTDSGKQRTVKAHRFAYVATYGPLPPDKPFACHSCDKNYPVGDTTYRRCCRPDHLFAGSCADNLKDAASKGRMASGTRHGSCTKPDRVPRGERHGMHRKALAKQPQ